MSPERLLTFHITAETTDIFLTLVGTSATGVGDGNGACTTTCICAQRAATGWIEQSVMDDLTYLAGNRPPGQPDARARLSRWVRQGSPPTVADLIAEYLEERWRP